MRPSPRALLAFLAVAASVAVGAPQDSIRIEADQGEFDHTADRSTYTGNVVLRRDNLELRGDHLVVTRDSDGRISAVLTGSPARLRQAPAEADAPPVTGAANRMTYHSASKRIELQGEAVVEREGNAIRSETISHDLTTGRTEARRAEGEDGERVRIILEPADEGGGDGQ